MSARAVFWRRRGGKRNTAVSFFAPQKELANDTDCPRMCAYKLVTVKFKWWGMQTKMENFIHKVCEAARQSFDL